MITELMDQLSELGTTWLWMVLLAAWRTLPVLILATGLGLALRRRLTPSLHALLLTIVVARLLLPVSVGSPMSLHKPIDSWFSSDSAESVKRDRHLQASDHRHSVLPNVDPVDSQDSFTWIPAPSPSANDYSLDPILCVIVLFVTISVSIGLLFRGVYLHIRFAIRLRSCRLLDDQPLIDLLLRECDSLAVGRRPALREVPSLAAPAVFGLFRKTICLPPNIIESLSQQEFRWVIRHELAHIRRHDIPVLIIASIAGALHWFNPVVWGIIRRLRAAMETAADRLALQSVSQSDAAAYGKLLLRFAEKSVSANRSPTVGLMCFASGRDLKQRVELVMRDSQPGGMSARFLSAGFATVVAFVGLTDAREVTPEMPPFDLVIRDSVELPIQPWVFDPCSANESDSPAYIETYDVASIFETMPEFWKQSEKTPLEQLTTWLNLFQSWKGKLQVQGHTLSAELNVRQHRLLKQTLESWKNGEPRQIVIETRLIQTNIQIASSIDWAGRRIDGLTVKGLGPAIAARIDEPELAMLVRAASADRKGNILFNPKVTLYDGQTAGIADQTQLPFVTGIESKADGSLQPIVSLVDDGLRFVLTPTTGEDDSITLAFEVTASSVGKVSYANLPIRASKSATQPFTVQVPATEQYAIISSTKLAPGESVVVAIPRVFSLEPGADAETTTIIALTPRILDIRGINASSGLNH